MLEQTLLHSTGNDTDLSTNVYHRTSTWKLGDAKVRTVVHVDSSYRSQSVYKVELWNGEKWNEVAHVAGTDPQLGTVTSGYLPAARSVEKVMYLEQVEQLLLEQATAVLV